MYQSKLALSNISVCTVGQQVAHLLIIANLDFLTNLANSACESLDLNSL